MSELEALRKQAAHNYKIAIESQTLCEHFEVENKRLRKALDSVRKDEREACAIVCESEAVGHRDGFGNHCAAIIRMIESKKSVRAVPPLNGGEESINTHAG